MAYFGSLSFNYRQLFFLVILLSIPLGIGLFTFYYGEGYAYFSNRPEACINCHIMQDQYQSWKLSTHRSFAVCNDCHSPKNVFAKLVNKGTNGFLHSLAFTTGHFADPIKIKGFNQKIALASCSKCHEDFVHSSSFGLSGLLEKNCLQCHRGVWH